jgi:hypothetical protein
MKTKFFTLLALCMGLSVGVVKAALADYVLTSHSAITAPTSNSGYTKSNVTDPDGSGFTVLKFDRAAGTAVSNPIIWGAASPSGINSNAGVNLGPTAASQYRYVVIKARKALNTANSLQIKFDLTGAISAAFSPLNVIESGVWVTYVFDVSSLNATYLRFNLYPENSGSTGALTTYFDNIYFTNTLPSFTTLSFKQVAPSAVRSATTVDLVWPPIVNSTSYKIYDGNDQLVFSGISPTPGTGGTTIRKEITGLTPNTSYTYKLAVVGLDAVESAKGNPITVKTRKGGVNYEIIDDFEDATNASTWSISNSGTITNATTNSLTGGFNPSSKCLKFSYSSTTGKNYAGPQTLSERIDVGSGAKYRYLHVKMYRNVTGTPLATPENGGLGGTLGGRTDATITGLVYTTKAYNATNFVVWTDYVYDLFTGSTFNPSSTANNTFFNWVIKANEFGTGSYLMQTAYDEYFDDVFLSNSATALTSNITTYNVTTVAGTGGTTIGDCSLLSGVTAPSTALVATPSIGYRFVNWTNTSGGAQVSTSASYTFTPSGAISLTANFIQTYSIAASAGTGGSVSGANTYDAGANVSLIATPASGYRFVNWTNTSDASVASTSATYAFNASTDVSVQANFSATTPVSVTISPTNASLLGLTIDNDVTVNNGGELIINQSATMNRLIVQAGGKVTVSDGQALNAGIVTLQNTATYVDKNTYTVSNPAPVISAAVSQTLTSGRNWYVSSPITTSTSLASQLSTATSVVGYNETTGLWDTQTGALTAGKGYISVSTSTNGDIAFNGTLNTGDVSVTLTRSGTNANKPGFNLVGNPYPSYINWTEATANAANVLTTIWYRTKDAGQYTFYTYNPVSDVAAPSTPGLTSYIPPMQAFWVRVKDSNGGTLTFTNAMRAHDLSGGANLLKAPAANKSQQQVLRLQVSNELNSDEAIVLFNPNASDGFDAYDSPKMSNANPAIPEIYTLAGSEHLVINGLSGVTANSELPLGFTPGASNTNFSIKATQVSNFDSNTQILLKDIVQNSEFDITSGKPYYFSSDATNTATRFTLVFKSNSVTTGINDKNTTDNIFLNIYRNENNQIAINRSGVIKEEGEITVYNSIGQQLVSTSTTGTSTVIKEPLNAGIYLIAVNIAGRKYTKKLILN